MAKETQWYVVRVTKRRVTIFPCDDKPEYFPGKQKGFSCYYDGTGDEDCWSAVGFMGGVMQITPDEEKSGNHLPVLKVDMKKLSTGFRSLRMLLGH